MAPIEPPPGDDLLTAYLLGSASERDTEWLDELSVADDGLAARLSAVEHDLVDAFVNGELSGDVLERFRARYLTSPALREKVAFADALAARPAAAAAKATHAVVQGAPRARRAVAWALASAAVLLLATGYFAIENARLRRQVRDEHAARTAAESREQQLAGQLSAERASPPEPAKEPVRPVTSPPRPPAVLSFVLLPATRGASDVQTIVVPAGADSVRLRLELESSEFSSYQATVRDGANRIVWRSGPIPVTSRGGNASTSVTISATFLKPGSFALELTGVSSGGGGEAVANYAFTVARR